MEHRAIASVLRDCCWSQIFNAVVIAASIFVVNLIRCPFAVYVEPRKMMLKEAGRINIKDTISKAIYMAGYLPRISSVPLRALRWIFLPPEDARARIVVKNSMEFGLRNRQSYNSHSETPFSDRLEAAGALDTLQSPRSFYHNPIRFSTALA